MCFLCHFRCHVLGSSWKENNMELMKIHCNLITSTQYIMHRGLMAIHPSNNASSYSVRCAYIVYDILPCYMDSMSEINVLCLIIK